MSIALSIADNGDGSGVVATVSGSVAGTTNALSYLPAPQTLNGTPAWIAAGSRVGDGTIAAAPGIGYFWWQLQNTNGSVVTVAPLVYSQASLNTQAVAYRTLTAVVARLQAVAFSGITAGQIQARYLPRARDKVDAWPLICVSPVGQEAAPPYLTGTDMVGEPFIVAAVDGQNQDFNSKLDVHLKWREQIGRAMRHQRLAGVPEVMSVMQDPSAKFDLAAFQHLWFISVGLFRAETRQPRGA